MSSFIFSLVPVSPVEGFGEETGSSAEPAATGILFGCGAGDGFVHVLLWDLVLLWEVVGDGRVVLHLSSSWIQRDENLRNSILESRILDFFFFFLRFQKMFDLRARCAFHELLTSSPASFFTTCWADNTLVAAMAEAKLCR